MARNIFSDLELTTDQIPEKIIDRTLERTATPGARNLILEIAGRTRQDQPDPYKVKDSDDLRTAFNPPDGVGQAEWSSMLRKQGRNNLASLYEQGASIKGSQVIIPVEQVKGQENQSNAGTAEVLNRLPTPELGVEFLRAVDGVVGQGAQGKDSQASEQKQALIAHYLKEINYKEQGGVRPDAERIAKTREVIASLQELGRELPGINPEDALESRGRQDIDHSFADRFGRTDPNMERIGEDVRLITIKDAEGREIEAVPEQSVERSSLAGGLEQEVVSADRTLDDEELDIEAASMERAEEAEAREMADTEREYAALEVTADREAGLDLKGLTQDEILSQQYNTDSIKIRLDTQAPEISLKDSAREAKLIEFTEKINDKLRQGGEVVNGHYTKASELVKEDARQYAYAVAGYAERAAAFEARLAQGERNGGDLFTQAASAIEAAKNPVEVKQIVAEQQKARSNELFAASRNEGRDARILQYEERQMLYQQGPHTKHYTPEMLNALRAPLNERTQDRSREEYALVAKRMSEINEKVTQPRSDTREGATEKHFETRAQKAQQAGYEIRQEAFQVRNFTERYVDRVLADDRYLRAQSESKIFRRGAEALSKVATVNGSEKEKIAAVKQVAKDISEFSQKQLVAAQGGARIPPDMQRLTQEQQRLLSAPGPHTKGYTPEMHKALAEQMTPASDRFAKTQALKRGDGERSENLAQIDRVIESARAKNGRPDAAKLSRVATLLVVNPDNLQKPLTKEEKEANVYERHKALDKSEKDYVFDKINGMRATALFNNPEKARPEVRGAAEQIRLSADCAEVRSKLEAALSKDDTRAWRPKPFEAKYLEMVARDRQEKLITERAPGQRQFGQSPIQSLSYQKYLKTVQEGRAAELNEATSRQASRTMRVYDARPSTTADGYQRYEYKTISNPVTERQALEVARQEARKLIGADYRDAKPGTPAHEVAKQVDQIGRYERDVVNARDAYASHRESIVGRVAGEKAAGGAAQARSDSWRKSWQQAVTEKDSPLAAALREHGKELAPTVQRHIKGEITPKEFAAKLEGQPENVREFLNGAATRANESGQEARQRVAEQAKSPEFQNFALSQATPNEKQMLKGYENAQQHLTERYFQSFEKLDQLIDQAERERGGLERTQTPERGLNRAEVADRNRVTTVADRESRDDTNFDYTPQEQMVERDDRADRAAALAAAMYDMDR